jgi:DNA-binding NarL/FixJ family response regulator
VRDGSPGELIAFTGTVGVGKSALLNELAREASEAGILVLQARGSAREQGFAFGIALQLFEQYVANLDESGLDQLLAGRAGLASPLLTGQGLRDPSALLREVPEASTVLTHALYRVTANLAASGPVVAIIDDLHWADPESVRFATYLGSRIAEIGCSLLVATEEGDSAAEDPLRADNARIQPLAPLTEGSVRELVRKQTGTCTARCAATCHWLTGGNPMLVHELIAAAEESGRRLDRDSAAEILASVPGRVRRRMLGPFEELSEEATAVAQASAVLGSTADRARIVATTDLDEEAMASAIDALESAGIFDSRRPLEYVYPLVRAAVYSLIPREERARLHSRAAAALRDSNSESIAIATHLMRSRPEGQAWVVEELLRAAAHARVDGELDRAVLYMGRALIEPPALETQVSVLVELGRTQTAAGATEPALATLRRATALAPEPTPAALALSLGRALYLQGETREAADVTDHAKLAGARARGEREELEASWLAAALVDPTLSAEARRRVAETNGLDAEGAAPSLLAIVACHLACTGEPRERAVSMAQSALARDPDDPATWAPALLALCWAGEATLALGIAGELAARPSVQHSQRALAALHLARAHGNHLVGRLDQAERDAREAAALVDQGTISDYVDCALTRHAGVLLDRGEVELAEGAIADATGAPYPAGSLVPAQILALRGRIHAARRQHQKAFATATEVGRLLAASGIENPSICSWRSQAAIAAAAIGDSDRARGLIGEELALARRFGAAAAIGIALTAAGRVATGTEALELLAEAEAVLNDSDSRLEHARTEGYLGASLRRNGSQNQALATLRSALQLATSVGDEGTASLARSELRLAGKRPRSPAADGAEALTVAEQRVTGLAADGLTNRQIAEQLFVTRKTVEWHLRNSYRKLGIKSRSELAQALAGKAAAVR